MLWVDVGCLPLLVGTWLSVLVNASAHSPAATLGLALVVPSHAAALLVSTAATSPALRRLVLRLAGRKAPPPPSERPNSPPARSSMAYRATAGGNAVSSPVGAGAAETARRHLGISNSSTTSRSTTKTSSSPYRSDAQLRNTSTSTSNYEPTARERRGAHTSDSESEGSERSLELASSHSSDEEASSRRASTLNGTTTVPNGTANGLPPARWPHTGSGGITYPPQLNIDSELFKAVYATARHSDADIPHRWTSSTISDNELGGGGIYGVRGATDPSKISNVYSDQEDKASLGDKYLFPYTAEEDHTLVGSGTVRPYGHPHPMVYSQGAPGMMTPTNGVASSPSPLAMHHEYMMYPDISENEKATSETHV